jgi:hypothetical protein
VNTNDGVTINIDYLYGGSRDDYLSSQNDAATFFLIMGAVFAGLGIVFIAGSIVAKLSTS